MTIGVKMKDEGGSVEEFLDKFGTGRATTWGCPYIILDIVYCV